MARTASASEEPSFLAAIEPYQAAKMLIATSDMAKWNKYTHVNENTITCMNRSDKSIYIVPHIITYIYMKMYIYI